MYIYIYIYIYIYTFTHTYMYTNSTCIHICMSCGCVNSENIYCRVEFGTEPASAGLFPIGP